MSKLHDISEELKAEILAESGFPKEAAASLFSEDMDGFANPASLAKAVEKLLAKKEYALSFLNGLAISVDPNLYPIFEDLKNKIKALKQLYYEAETDNLDCQIYKLNQSKRKIFEQYNEYFWDEAKLDQIADDYRD